MRSLEVEVAKLRERDAQHAAEIGSCRILIGKLQALLVANNIPVPDDLKLSSSNHPQASVSFVDCPDGTQSLQATMPTFHQFRQEQQHLQDVQSPEHLISATETRTTSDTGETNRNHMAQMGAPSLSRQQYSGTVRSQFSHTDSPHPHNHLHSASPTRGLNVNNLDTAQAAVDFVLALEKPCLAHQPADFDDLDADANGHSLMLQTPFLTRQPNRAKDSAGSARVGERHFNPQTTWSVPALEIEKLLSLSHRLSLDGELTPIEAWQRLRKHPGFEGMKYDQLEAVRDVLLQNVKCYG